MVQHKQKKNERNQIKAKLKQKSHKSNKNRITQTKVRIKGCIALKTE